jgi:hypothetical protein
LKIKALNFALASAITDAIVWIMPGAMMTTTGNMVHMDMSKFGWMISLGGVFLGLIIWSLFAGIFAWLLATIYNLLTKN